MQKIPDYQAKDMILQFLVENDTAESEHVFFSSEQLFEKLKLERTEDQVNCLLKEIHDTSGPIVHAIVKSDELLYFNAQYQANGMTKVFVAEGGYTKKFNEVAAAAAVEQQDKELDRKVKHDALSLNKWNKMFLIINAILVIINVWFVCLKVKG